MIETGATITLQDNASSNARKIADELKEVGKSADAVNESFDNRHLDTYNNKLTEISESYSKLNRELTRHHQSQESRVSSVNRAFSQAGGAVMQTAGGNVAGGVLSGAGGLTKLATGVFGTAGGVIAGLGMATGMAGNKLADMYQQRAGSAQRLAALQDDENWFDDIATNSQLLRDAMKNTTDYVTRFGKTYEEGAAANEQFLRAGGKNFEGTRAAEYSLAYGANLGNLSQFGGMTQRYGQTDALDKTWALLRTQGLGAGQFEEVMGGIQDTFTAALSRGVVRSLDDITRSQEFFSRAGVTFQGGLGAQRLQGLNQGVAGAAGLQSESDIFLYRAAQRITGGDMIETKKLMERGLSPELFKGLMGEFETFGYGRTESILQLSKMFGISTTASEQLFDIRDEPVTSTELQNRTAKGMAKGVGVTRETEYQRIIESIKQTLVGGMGGGAFDVRAGVVGAGETILKLFSELLGPAPKIGEGKRENLYGLNELIDMEAYVDKIVFDPINKALEKGTQGVPELNKLIEEAMQQGLTRADLYQYATRIRGGLGVTGVMGLYSAGGPRVTESELERIAELLEDLIEIAKSPVEMIE